MAAALPHPKPAPAPQGADEEDNAAAGEGEGYQLEMMRCLREINVDNNMVGWYQSTYSGSFQVGFGATFAVWTPSG